MKTTLLLEQIARLAGCGPKEARPSLREALGLISAAFGAGESHIIYGADWFRRLDDPRDPEEYEITQQGYWIINRFMVEQRRPCAFNHVDRRVRNVTVARTGIFRTHVAAMIPLTEGSSEMLVIGPLSRKLQRSQIAVLQTCGPILIPLLQRVIDEQHAQRRQRQLRSLADIARVVTHTNDREQVLAEIATAAAMATGFDIVALSIFDSTKERFVHRVLNLQRFAEHSVADTYRQGALDPVMAMLAHRKKPALYPDLANDQRIAEGIRQLLAKTGLIASMACMPLVFQDEVLGIMSLNSQHPHKLDPEEVQLLEGVAAHVAMILKGVDMYEELRSSREKLEKYAEQLKESMSIEYRLARTDSLTGIANRRYLEEALTNQVEKAAQDGSPLAIVMADIDRFKEFNDHFGHAFGDDILRMVASQSWQICRRGEIVGRYGGDEFLFILPNRRLQQATLFAEDFRKVVEGATLYAPSGTSVSVTASVGVVACEARHPKALTGLVRAADQAMYQAKSAGGNRVAVGDAELVAGKAG